MKQIKTYHYDGIGITTFKDAKKSDSVLNAGNHPDATHCFRVDPRPSDSDWIRLDTQRKFGTFEAVLKEMKTHPEDYRRFYSADHEIEIHLADHHRTAVIIVQAFFEDGAHRTFENVITQAGDLGEEVGQLIDHGCNAPNSPFTIWNHKGTREMKPDGEWCYVEEAANNKGVIRYEITAQELYSGGAYPMVESEENLSWTPEGSLVAAEWCREVAE